MRPLAPILFAAYLSLAASPRPPVLREAQQALADGLPEVAAAKFSRALSEGAGFPKELVPAAKLQLLEAYVRSGNPADALALNFDPTPDTAYWTAQAQARINHLTRALETLKSIPAEHPRAHDAALARADILSALGEKDEALATLATLLPDPRAALHSAEIHLATNAPEDAIAVLETLDKRTPQTVYLLARAALESARPNAALSLLGTTPGTDEPQGLAGHFALARARALHATGETAAAREGLLEFARIAPGHPLAPLALAALEPMGVFSDPAVLPALESIIALDPPEPLAHAAGFFRVLTLANTAKSAAENRAALRAVEAFAESLASVQPKPEEFLRTALVYEDLKYRVGSPDGPATAKKNFIQDPPEEVRKRLADLKARALYRAGRFPEAAESFLGSGATGSYNAAVAGLRAEGDGAEEPTAPTDPALLLERGLYAAGAGRSTAASMLGKFLSDHPEHPGAYRAHLALAELASLTFPPKPRSAAAHLAAARESAPPRDSDILQRIDRAGFWASESADDPSTMTALGTAFLQRWPESPYRAEIRMKLGETAFRAGNFPAARIQFETLAENFPDSPLAEAALFFAARAALSMSPGGTQNIDDAIDLWEKVASRKGALFFYAREQQALTKHSQGLDADAIQILESILAAVPPAPPDLRASARIALGECRFNLAGNDPAKRAAAIETYEALAADPTAPPLWREKAREVKARALQLTGKTDEALEIYYDIVRTPIDTTSTASRFRAGFEAIRLLEASGNWEGAITLADTLADSPGPRAAEASALAERLKLQHFVYDEKSEL